MRVDQEVNGPAYDLAAALARPDYPGISAVSLVRVAIKKEQGNGWVL